MSILLKDNIRTTNQRLRQVRRRKIWQGLGLLLLIIAGALTAHLWSPLGASPKGERLARIQKSPHYKDGNFQNSLAIINSSFWELTKAYTSNTATALYPKAPIPVVKPTFKEPAPAGLRVTWLGHSTFIVAIDGVRVLVDPVFGPTASPSPYVGPKRYHPPPLTVKELPKIDAIVISHDHYDHLDEPTIRELNGLGAKFFVPLGVGSHLEFWDVPVADIVELDWWQSGKVGEVELVATPARHASGRGLLDQNTTQWAGWAMIGTQHRVFYSGDTGMFPGFKEIGDKLGPFDVTMFELGAYSGLWPDWHLGPEQALQAHLDVKGKMLLPVHWGTFNLALHNWTEPIERVRAGAAGKDISYITPKPGETIDLAAPPAPKQWWEKVPWRTAAEAPVVASGM